MSDRTCDNCGIALQPMFPRESRRYSDDQYVECLHVIVQGGYGEFIDGAAHLRFCDCCARSMVDERWFETAMRKADYAE